MKYVNGFSFDDTSSDISVSCRTDPNWEPPKESLASRLKPFLDMGFIVTARVKMGTQTFYEYYEVTKASPYRKHIFWFKDNGDSHVETRHAAPKCPTHCERCGAGNPSYSVCCRLDQTERPSSEWPDTIYVCKACYNPKVDQGCLMEWGWADSPGVSGSSGIKREDVSGWSGMKG